MSNEIDWSKAPKGADKIVENPLSHDLHWGRDDEVLVNGNWMLNGGYHTIATRPDEPARKTVKDAVQYYGELGLPYNLNPSSTHVYWHTTDKRFYFLSAVESKKERKLQLVCTRAEFEAEAERQKGEEWTHVYCGEKCKVVGEPDKLGSIVILIEGNVYFIDKPESLKPIKPTISKAEAYDRIVEWLENEDSQLSKELFWQKFQRINEVV